MSLLLDGIISSNASELALEADPCWVVRTAIGRVVWSSTLRVCVVMVVLIRMLVQSIQPCKKASHAVVSSTMIVPARNAVN